MLNINNPVSMKPKMTALVAGAMLAITAAMPASASVSNTNGQALTGEQQSRLLLAEKGNTKGGQSTIVTPQNNKTNKWQLDKKSAKLNQLTSVEKQNLEKFQNALNQGLSPQQAAQKVPNAKYTRVKGTQNQYQMRLSEKARATFLVNNKNHSVELLQVSDYTRQMKTNTHR
ncbi:hypothetical protein [Chroococcidiopsis sp. CCNUC1]|uniref:hypothetical protein n=1 Tax=Chroococcidiopsis sp. CCNUC1 TaxID=2653189 RepID=UPI0020227EF6|nr:hypothetical protein [Chroococcidiopsis sp. CCNUC1]URD53705.1 hypothetical protein M5J74_31895 [Chroococcidiopsis sp. CCNUC1]